MKPATSATSDMPAMPSKKALSDAAAQVVLDHAKEFVPQLVAKHAEGLKEKLADEVAKILTSDEFINEIAERLPARRVSHFGSLTYQDGQLRADLASGSGASLVGITQSGSGATSRTVQAKLRERCVSVMDFGATGDGTTNDLAAIRAAFAASKHVYFPQPSVSYYLGSAPSGNVWITADGDAGKLSIVTEGVVKITVDSEENTYPIFRVIDANGVKIGSFHFNDTDYDHTESTFNGAIGFLIEASSGLTLPVKNVEIDSIYAENMGAALMTAGNTASVRVEGINVGKIYCDTCYYGVNCQNNGDALNVGVLWTDDVKRSYFFYGTRGSKVFVYSTNGANSTGDLNISTYSDGLDTTDHEIHYVSKTPVSTTDLISFNALGEGSKKIQNIKLHVDIESTTSANVITCYAYNLAGTVENTGATNNVFGPIELTGRIVAASAADFFDINCQPSTLGVLTLGAGIDRSKVTNNAKTYFNIATPRKGQGTDVASANNLALNVDGDYFQVTGATQINLIDCTTVIPGIPFTLKFDSTPTVKDDQTSSGNNKKIVLEGSADFVASADDTLTLVYDRQDAVFYEVTRSAN